MRLRYETVLLDLDHTLFDSDFSESVAFEQTLASAGVPTSRHLLALYQQINLELWAAVERGELQPETVRFRRFERFVSDARLDADPRRMADDFVSGLAHNGELYDGARELVARLSEHVRLGLVTNGFSEVQRTRLTRLGIAQDFDAITISAEVGAAKPHPKIFDAAFAALGQPDRSSALMVGDNLSSDIGGGATYGIGTCWYNPSGRGHEGAHAPSHEVARLEDVLSLVGLRA